MDTINKIIFDSLKDKYFLKLGESLEIITFKESPLRFKRTIEATSIYVWNPLEEYETLINVDDLVNYEIITEERFKEEKKKYISGHLRAMKHAGPID